MDWRRLVRLRRRPDVRAEAPELDQLLAAALRASNAIQHVAWTRSALRWIEKDLKAPGDSDGIARAHARLRFLLQMVDRATDGGRAVRGVLSGLLAEIDFEQLTAAGGIPRRSGFLKELYERCLAAILPQPDYRAEPALLVGTLLGRAKTMAWIDLLPSEDARKMARLFVTPESVERIDPQLGAAMLTLASEAQAVGLASDMRRRFADSSALQSPFGQLVRCGM